MQPIFIGDVQGCADELDEMLARAADRFGEDWTAWIVGDLINRGPGNLAALERIRALVEVGRAQYILGNHEIGLIETFYGLRKPGRYDTAAVLLERADAADWIDWLRRRPLAVVGELAGSRFVMVHAAVHPTWSLDDVARIAARVSERLGADESDAARAFLAADLASDPDRDALALLTRCRSIASDGRWSSRVPEPGSEPWHALWSRNAHTYGVVYGHWALQGLHVAAGLRGLDTGCVHHGRPGDRFLTAWVPAPSRGLRRDGAGPFDAPDDAFWRVRARRAYYADVLTERSRK